MMDSAATIGGVAAAGGMAAATSNFLGDTQEQTEVIESENLELETIELVDRQEDIIDTIDSAATESIADAEILSEQITKLQTTDRITDIDTDTQAIDSMSQLRNTTFADNAEAIGGGTAIGSNFFNQAKEQTETDEDLNLDNVSLDDITFEKTDEDLNLDNVSLDDITFEETDEDSISNLLDNVQDSSIELSENTSNDIDNISEWLDSLETPNTSSDNISEWLESLETNSATSSSLNNQESTTTTNNMTTDNSLSHLTGDIPQQEVDSKSRIEDISLQFLEDLLDRDSKSHQDDQ